MNLDELNFAEAHSNEFVGAFVTLIYASSKAPRTVDAFVGPGLPWRTQPQDSYARHPANHDVLVEVIRRLGIRSRFFCDP
jgi:hypothetical protein